MSDVTFEYTEAVKKDKEKKFHHKPDFKSVDDFNTNHYKSDGSIVVKNWYFHVNSQYQRKMKEIELQISQIIGGHEDV